MKFTRNNSRAAREPILSTEQGAHQKLHKQYCKNNRERINEYISYYAKNKERIRQRLRDQKHRKIDQNILRLRAWDQESEKLKTSLVPSGTFCGTLTVKS